MMHSADYSIKFFRQTLPLLLLTLALLFSTPLVAQEEKADEPEAAGDVSTLNLPIPVGQTSTGVVIQDLDDFGTETSLLKALTAIRVSEDKIEFQGLELVLSKPDQKPVTIILEKGVYDSQKRVLYSQSEVIIKREDFTLWGEALEYNVATGSGKIIGKNRMLIHEIGDYVPWNSKSPEEGADEEKNAGEIAPGDQSARANASAESQIRLLTEL